MNKNNVNFIAIDFETATSKRNSICEAGICVVKNSKIITSKSWLVRPQDNYYHSYNIQIHGITPKDTENAPNFDEVWANINDNYCDGINTFVAHNASFDKSCLEQCASLYNINLPKINWVCTLQIARSIYNFEKNNLNYLCNNLGIDYDDYHRAANDATMCAKLYLKQLQSI